MKPIILASGSEVRAALLRKSGVDIEVTPAKIDEEILKEAMVEAAAHPRDIADALAEAKARKISQKCPDRFVIGADQVLELDGRIFSKPGSREDAFSQLFQMQGKKHRLFSAAVIYEDCRPVWRYVGQVTVHMRQMSENWLHEYVDRNWASIQDTVGCYKLEEEGARLFTRIEGDYFSILGIPLLEILSYLTLRGRLSS